MGQSQYSVSMSFFNFFYHINLQFNSMSVRRDDYMASWYLQKMSENVLKATDLADLWGVEWRKQLKDDWAQMMKVLDDICERIMDSTLSPCGPRALPAPPAPDGSQSQEHTSNPSEAAWSSKPSEWSSSWSSRPDVRCHGWELCGCDVRCQMSFVIFGNSQMSSDVRCHGWELCGCDVRCQMSFVIFHLVLVLQHNAPQTPMAGALYRP